MSKFGLIGDPINLSKSPDLFRAAYKGKKQEDGSDYLYDLIEGNDFEKSFQTFLDGYKAINVTAPFKQDAYSKVYDLAVQGKGIVSGPASRIGATNLVVKGEHGLEAHNTDFTGIVLAIAEAFYKGITKEFLGEFGKNFYIKIHQFFRMSLTNAYNRIPQALIVGCGGAGRAAAVAAAELGFETALMNRTPEKAQELASELPDYGFIPVPIKDFKEAIRECDLIIYTLPAKLDDIDELCADDFADSGSGRAKVILEANYKNPSFSEEARMKINSADGVYVSGEQWLLFQALAGYSIMTGVNPDLESMADVFRG